MEHESRPGVSRPGVSGPGVQGQEYQGQVYRARCTGPGVSRPGVSRPGVPGQEYQGQVYQARCTSPGMARVYQSRHGPGVPVLAWSMVHHPGYTPPCTMDLPLAMHQRPSPRFPCTSVNLRLLDSHLPCTIKDLTDIIDSLLTHY